MDTMKSVCNKYGLMVLTPVAVFTVLCVLFPGSITKNNIPTLLRQAIAPSVLGWGVLFNMKVGNWDFSVGSEVLLSAIIAGNLAIIYGFGFVGMAVLAVLIGLIAGLCVGLIFYTLKIPTIITSIGVLLIYESISGYVFDGAGVYLPSDWPLFSYTSLYVAAVIIALFAYFLFYKTKLGYNIRAVGNNPVVAAANGLNVYKVKVSAIIIAGMFAGIYAMISLGSSGVQRPVSSMGSVGTCFDAMMCVFIGTSITRKGNLIAGLYCGSLVCQMIKLFLMVISFPSQYNTIVIAALVVVFMSMDAASSKREKKRRVIMEN